VKVIEPANEKNLLSQSYTSIDTFKTDNVDIKIENPPQPLPKRKPGEYQHLLNVWMGPTTKPKIKRISEPKGQVVWWEKMIDLVMGEEDYALICGNCSTYHGCVPKDEKSQDFICRSCGAYNKNESDNKVEEILKENIVKVDGSNDTEIENKVFDNISNESKENIKNEIKEDLGIKEEIKSKVEVTEIEKFDNISNESKEDNIKNVIKEEIKNIEGYNVKKKSQKTI